MHRTPSAESSFGHVTKPAQILRAVLSREAEVGAQSLANVVAVKNSHGEPPVEKGPRKTARQRTLARPGETGEPEDPPHMPMALKSLNPFNL
jgi:hypothetical protein